MAGGDDGGGFFTGGGVVAASGSYPLWSLTIYRFPFTCHGATATRAPHGRRGLGSWLPPPERRPCSVAGDIVVRGRPDGGAVGGIRGSGVGGRGVAGGGIVASGPTACHHRCVYPCLSSCLHRRDDTALARRRVRGVQRARHSGGGGGYGKGGRMGGERAGATAIATAAPSAPPSQTYYIACARQQSFPEAHCARSARNAPQPRPHKTDLRRGACPCSTKRRLHNMARLLLRTRFSSRRGSHGRAKHVCPPQADGPRIVKTWNCAALGLR